LEKRIEVIFQINYPSRGDTGDQNSRKKNIFDVQISVMVQGEKGLV
jgi:hypothetical protein